MMSPRPRGGRLLQHRPLFSSSSKNQSGLPTQKPVRHRRIASWAWGAQLNSATPGVRRVPRVEAVEHHAAVVVPATRSAPWMLRHSTPSARKGEEPRCCLSCGAPGFAEDDTIALLSVDLGDQPAVLVHRDGRLDVRFVRALHTANGRPICRKTHGRDGPSLCNRSAAHTARPPSPGPSSARTNSQTIIPAYMWPSWYWSVSSELSEMDRG